MKQIKLIIKRLLYLIYYGVIFFRIANFGIFFNQLRRQIFSRSNQIALVLNLDEYEFPEIKANIKYTLDLATKEDMDEILEKAKSESKGMVQKLIFRKWMFEDGYQNCYVARTVDTNEICTIGFIIYPTDDMKVEGRFRRWFSRLRKEEVILEGAYTFEKFRGNRLHPAIIIDRLRICKEQGYRRILGYIEESNEASLKGAERVGFKRFGSVPELKFMFFTFRKYHQYQRQDEVKTAPVSIIDPTIDNRWDEFVTGQENSTIFHTSTWARVIQETYDYLPRYHIIANDDGQMRAAIPFYFIQCRLTGRRLVCLPFSDYCWPLGEKTEDINLLLSTTRNEIDKGRDKPKNIEIRGWQSEAPEPQQHLLSYDYYTRYLLELNPDTEVLRSKFHLSIRRCIQQAERRNINVRFSNKKEDMEHFYQLHVATRKKLGVFPQPYTFFNSIYRNIILQNRGFIVLAEYDNKIVAGVVFLVHGDTIYYKYNASYEKYLQKRPNHMIIWETIKYASSHNYKYFDFGRCSPQETGLHTFKSRWGAKPIPTPYYYFPTRRNFVTIAESDAFTRIMRLLTRIIPRSAFVAIGSFVYKHIG